MAALWPGDLFLTGGALRDRLLGRGHADLDLAVVGDARAAASRVATALGGRCFPLGRHPLVTWRVLAGQRHLDFWGIVGDIEADIRRRDFTVNAMFWRLPRGPLIDLVGGLDDLEASRIRVVSPNNLRADPLRVLRGVRLVATHGELRLTAATESQLAAAAGGLRGVARERVIDELRLLLAGAAVGRALRAAARLGILAVLRPEWEGYAAVPLVTEVGVALVALQRRGHSALGRAAREVAPALLAAPAAGFPDGWQSSRAVEALLAIGWPPAAAERAAAAAGLGERLRSLIGVDLMAARELAVEAGERLGAALAWATARTAASNGDLYPAAVRLHRWWRHFCSRAPLLDGSEIAQLLALPPGPPRAEAVVALRRAQARGAVRSRAQAREFLTSLHAR
ncbi:MAG: hypothetical protein ACHQQS_13680 [Thermoanaerobaculales bacterium]